MKSLHGFVSLRRLDIPEIGGAAEVLVHEKTGARLLSVTCPDENKVFGVSFRTPPDDSTGLPHILEHSVLCGSRKYPVKEPFVELLKGSLQTFLNALTFPDKTCYPVASTNHKDFYNLTDVYLDAVFHPLLTPLTLMQEGWRYDPKNPGDPSAGFGFKGVVFNEMKGAYSSPDSVLHELSQQVLFPDTAYGLDSGGDPERIPDLSFEAFERFHRERYHPSNAYAFFYGDDDPERRLAILDACFSEYERREPAPAVARQPPFPAPRRIVRTYAADEEGDGGRGFFTLGFVLAENGDPDLSLALEILEHVLIGLPSSPLRKALMDSGLGEDLAGVGLEEDLRQIYFSAGLKGMDPADADRVEALVLDTLGGLAKDGIDPGDLEAAVNSVEFDLRENNTGSYPRGLILMFRSLAAWLHDGDPLALIPYEAPLARLKARLAAGERVLEDLLARLFLDNPHRAGLLLVPDQNLSRERDDREKARLDAAWKAMDSNTLAAVLADNERLRLRQEAPDRPEDLARIPRLTLADLPPKNVPIPLAQEELGGVPLLSHDLRTSGLVYLDLGFDLNVLPARLLPLAPLFGRALLEMGTRRRGFVDLTRAIARKTGGIDPQLLVSPVRGAGPGVAAARLFLRGKATAERAPELLDLLAEILLEAEFSDRDRFRRIVLEAKARREERLAPSGHSLVATRLKSAFSRAGAMEEAMHGVSGLFYVRDLVRRVEEDFDGVLADLEEMRALLLTRPGLLANLTADAAGTAAVRPGLAGLLASFPDRLQQTATWTAPAFPAREGLAIPAQVNYVGKGAEVFSTGFSATGAAHVVVRSLRAGYLWDRVRVRGGAYGAFCLFDRLTGTVCFVSYRDPNLAATLEAFDAAADHLLGLDLHRDELEKAVIGAIGEMDAYLLPDAKGFVSMARRLSGEDEDFRQRIREEALAATVEDFRAFGRAVAEVARAGRVAVLGSQEVLAASDLDLEVVRVL